jgi:protein-disulfide isomerase
LTELERRYGEKRLRVVIKHLPLSRHAGAIPAARVAQAVLAMAGPGKFFEYLDRAFADQERVALGRALEIAVPLGLDLEALRARAASAAIGAQVVRDVALADKVGVPATPHFRVNGLGVTGAQPVELMVRVIEAELIEVARLLGAGVPPESAYARRVVANLSEPEPKL